MKQPAPPTPSADQQRLALLIEAESMQLGEFLAILEREEGLLVQGDTDALVNVANEKNERYRQLQRLHDERSLLLARMGHGVSDAAIRKICANLPRVLARWDEVISRARQARDRNALNGQLILERMAGNQAALTVLLSAANHPQLYDADGLAKPTGGGRILGSA
ncbi:MULTISPECIES: flagella synthesis protein FlgN [Thauera]|uniref:flagella synthesis protein FlgN n=1 Tax=Thauera TaxID=33057 RepID=UPI0002F685A7|nr:MULTISPECIES: flagellar protein FlgN [Thauera]MCM8565413.1 flagellar protein FlgN [Thauera linaloolentis]